MKKMKVLIVGAGGREHALAWKLSQSKLVEKLYCAPGNGGIAELAECVALRVDDIEGIVAWAKKEGIDLVVIGPELPLTLGLADELEKAGIKAFGPRAKAAEIEGSKVFAKDLLRKYEIPTARYGVFDEVVKAREFVRELPGPWVVKADGLAAGKGVFICSTRQDADEAVGNLLSGDVLGAAGKKVVVEEYLEGEELSILAFCDGKTIVPMVPSQDHKRAYDGDEGPNTGGMGAYTPVPVASSELMKEIEEKILKPVITAMEKEGRTYQGVLYPGLMLTKEGPKVLEFNCRFGDPETQVVLPRLESDLGEIILAVVEGRLGDVEIKWKNEACITVIMASGGYPGSYEKGYAIEGLTEAATEGNGVLVFHSGTKRCEGKLLTDGGRVLAVTACAGDLPEAREYAYRAVERITFKDRQYRKDIAYRALKP